MSGPLKHLPGRAAALNRAEHRQRKQAVARGIVPFDANSWKNDDMRCKLCARWQRSLQPHPREFENRAHVRRALKPKEACNFNVGHS